MKTYNITVNGVTYTVNVEEVSGTASAAASAPVAAAAPVAAPTPAAAPAPAKSGNAGSVVVKAPMQGTIVKVNAKVGAAVKKGDVLAVLEAMKMENDIVAPCDGTVKQLLVSKGSTVNTDDILAII